MLKVIILTLCASLALANVQQQPGRTTTTSKTVVVEDAGADVEDTVADVVEPNADVEEPMGLPYPIAETNNLRANTVPGSLLEVAVGRRCWRIQHFGGGAELWRCQ